MFAPTGELSVTDVGAVALIVRACEFVRNYVQHGQV